MSALLEKLDAVVEELEDYEPSTDAQAWLKREALQVLDRARGILAVLTEKS